MRVRFLDVDGINTRYYVSGEGKSGTPLLLIHGVGSSGDIFIRCIDQLAVDRPVYALDLVGHGFADMVDFGDRPPQRVQLDQLFGFMKALGVKRYIPAGSSFGGLLAALMYFERPQEVEKLILIGTGSTFNPADDQVPVLQAVLKNQINAASDPTPETIRPRNAGSTYEKGDTFEEIVFTQLTSYALPGRAMALKQTVEGLIATVDSKEYRVVERLEGIKCPTLIITGREDIRAPWKNVIAGHERIAGSVLHIFEKCGHKPFAEHAEAFVEKVLHFLK